MIEEKYPNIFKINCASFCINLILKELDTLEHVSPILEGSRKIINFVCKYQQVLSLMKTHTNGRELKRSSATRSATNFMHLQSILKEEQALQNMAATAEWRDLMQCKGLDGLEVQKLLQDNVFWDRGKELMNAIEPLVKVMKLVDSDGSTSGYIYKDMHRAKEAIKKKNKGEAFKFMPFWKVIDHAWNNLLRCNIHAAAAYLNPHLFHDRCVKLDSEAEVGAEKVIQRMVSHNDERMKIAEELRLSSTWIPVFWTYGSQVSSHISPKNLVGRGAVRSLLYKVWQLKCLANLAAPQHARENVCLMFHVQKRQQLDTIRLQDLLYVRLNMHLMKTSKPRRNDSMPIEAFVDELEGIDLHEDWGISDDKELVEEEENEDDVCIQSLANGFCCLRDSLNPRTLSCILFLLSLYYMYFVILMMLK